jgi:imidazolonepropionase-like amidohydrolase
VIVTNGRITAITPATTKAPTGAIQVDGRGKFLMPGLSEMHAHIPGANAAPQLIQDIMYLYVANGVTTIRGMLGAPNQLLLRDRAARNEIIAPSIIVGAPSLNGNSAPTPEAAAILVAQNIAAGYDLQKVHPGFSRVAYDSALAVARRSNFKFAGHVPADVGLAHAIEARQDIDHLDGYMEAATPLEMQARMAHPTEQVSLADVLASIDKSAIPELVRLTRAAGIYNAPTMYLWQNFFDTPNPDSLAALPEMKYVPGQWVQNWINQKRQRQGFDAQNNLTDQHRDNLLSFRRQLIKALADGGALLMLGTDSPQMFNVPGFALHREVGVLADAGLTPFQILVSGTANVGRYTREVLGKPDAFGTVQVGQRADLVLLDANPLQDIRNLQRRAGVMVRGRWLDAKALQAGLDEIAARYAQAAS